jgi:putative oxidoreductase
MLGPLKDLIVLLGRVMVAGVFLYDATVIIRGWDAAVAYSERFGVPGSLLPLAVLLQIGGGVLIIIGLLTRPVALAFAGFCTLTALLFHNNLASSAEAIQFGKDFAMAGGFLFLIVTGAGQWSLDARIGAR